MNILIAGSSGMLGSSLIPFLTQEGHQVQRLIRKTGRCPCKKSNNNYCWNPEKRQLNPVLFENIDVVINLSGDNIFSDRWTKDKKDAIRSSRVQTTQFLAETMASLDTPPKLFINASAVGIYGSRGDAFLSESSPPGEGFLADVVKEWEQATEPAEKAGIRVIHLRLGAVLSNTGGALKKVINPFKWGLGGVLGSGNQYMSWIMIDDVLRIFSFLIEHQEVRGAVNAVAPHPVTNEEFTKTLGKLLHRPTFFWLSEFILCLIFGEMAKDVFLSSVRAEPIALTRAGFKFKYPQLQKALKTLLN